MESKGIREPMQLAETFSLDQDEIDRNIPEALLELKEMVQLNTLINVVDCSSFFKYFNSREIASDVFDDVDAADERSIFNLLVD
jgi:G3E family GTPase